MRFEHESGRVYVRQSWLNDLMLCPERARLGVVRPNMRTATDATIMGTAVHASIETVLNGGSITDIADNALAEFAKLQQDPYKVTNLKPEKYEAHIVSMTTAWVEDILPVVQLGGDVEYPFKFPIGVTVGDWDVWCEGTMDYVQPDGTVWDWKTSSRKYDTWDKQSTSIQATVYTGAIAHIRNLEPPFTFRYGVMVRGDKPVAQIVDIHRTTAHMHWLRALVAPAVHLALAVGEHSNWIMNDTSVLCSEKWCSFWSICKGGHLSPADIYPPKVDKP